MIVSIAVAAANSNATGGLKSASFAAIWSMFLVIAFAIVGAQIVFGGRSSELLVGFMIGTAAMLTELFFVLMVIFFVMGENASTNNYKTAPSNKAYAVFSLLNMIIYFVWAIILTVHRKSVMVSQQELDAAHSKEFAAYDGSHETYNPTIGAAEGADDFHGDQEDV
ncbi:hypothetical protein EON64_16150 [archaeon]|nr:MAG: hypothetical protein EON64_16150 [archaeon]